MKIETRNASLASALKKTLANMRGAMCDASDLGLAPGVWPNELEVGEHVFKRLRFDRNADREVTCAIYFSFYGRVLRVFND